MVATLSFAALAFQSAVLRGIVADPQGLPVARAHVALACAARTVNTLTDGRGEFTVFRDDRPGTCLLTVRVPGFLEYSVHVAGSTRTVAVSLTMARRTEVVLVRPDAIDDQNERTTGITVSRDELMAISSDTDQLIAYSLTKAGASAAPTNVYVDGLPATTLPPGRIVKRISVNTDPFSAEYADGDGNRVDIATDEGDSAWHFNAGVAPMTFGGRNPLVPHAQADSKSFAPALTGRVPLVPVTFSVDGQVASTRSAQAVFTGEPGAGATFANAAPILQTDSRALFINAHYSGDHSLRGALALGISDERVRNFGAGAFTSEEGASASSFGTREVRASLSGRTRRIVWNTGLAISMIRTQADANSTAVGVELPGYFTEGGAPIQRSDRRQQTWIWKTVVHPYSEHSSWSAGLSVGGEHVAVDLVPNPGGHVTLSLPEGGLIDGNATTGVWILALDRASVHGRSATAASFIERQWGRSRKMTLTTGLRADYQSAAGVMMSPRVSLDRTVHGYRLSSGAGLFVHPWSESVLAEMRTNNQNQLNRVVFPSVVLEGSEIIPESASIPITTEISSTLVRPREVMLREGVERRLKRWTTGAEYTWIDGSHLFGSQRLISDLGWTDLLESNRSAARQELHTRAQYAASSTSITLNYSWIRACDNTDGPFSYPEYQNDLQREWSRSSGVPEQTATMVANVQIPASIRLSVVGAWHSAAPYSILTGRDVSGDGLFNDRGGNPRNSSDGPDYRSVSVYGFRRVSVPARGLGGRRVGADLLIRADNVFGNRNATVLGSVIGSPTYGRALAMLRGRSVALTIRLAH